jgi:hypothetical protein
MQADASFESPRADDRRRSNRAFGFGIDDHAIKWAEQVTRLQAVGPNGKRGVLDERATRRHTQDAKRSSQGASSNATAPGLPHRRSPPHEIDAFRNRW